MSLREVIAEALAKDPAGRPSIGATDVPFRLADAILAAVAEHPDELREWLVEVGVVEPQGRWCVKGRHMWGLDCPDHWQPVYRFIPGSET
jgi:hypothetical protein